MCECVIEQMGYKWVTKPINNDVSIHPSPKTKHVCVLKGENNLH